MNSSDKFLQSTYFINSDSEVIRELVKQIVGSANSEIEKAKNIFYWTRDKIPYDPYTFSFTKRDYKASTIIKKGRGWCVQKAVVLATLARAINIPSRLHFADIHNFQVTPKLKKEMGTDLFIFHGYVDLLLNSRWVKATPAFNIELCQKFNYRVVEFDGIHDAILPETTLDGKKHIEYLKDRGVYPDLPLKEIIKVCAEVYLVDGSGSLNVFSK
ncbi:MAG: transglutaminase-like domain-containing protein [Candidatus Helarchaeota archaeon]